MNEGVWSGLPARDRSCFSINAQMLDISLPQQTRQGLLLGKMGACTVVLGWWKNRVAVGEAFCLIRKTVCQGGVKIRAVRLELPWGQDHSAVSKQTGPGQLCTASL